MIDLLTAPIDELGLSPETLKALNKRPAAAGAFAGGRRAALTVERVLLMLQSPGPRRRLCEAIGRRAYAELVAELDDHGLIPERWGVGVEAAFPVEPSRLVRDVDLEAPPVPPVPVRGVRVLVDARGRVVG